MENSLFSEGRLNESYFQEATLKKVHFKNIDMDEIDLKGTDLRGVDLSEATFEKISLDIPLAKGLIIDYSQAYKIISLCGIVIK